MPLPTPNPDPDPNPQRSRVPGAFLVAILAAGAVVGPLLVGFEPVGGDPDRIYRPIKAELVRALENGTLPYWSDRFGIGLPMVAESHAAAFYPVDLALYAGFGVSGGYRLSMWLHIVALAAATWAYGRHLGLSPWGATLAALAFTFCGMQAIHSSHEWMFHTLPYLPLALVIVDLYAATGRTRWLGLLMLALGAQWTLGHFQIQTWTNALVLWIGVWRVVADGRPKRRVLGVGAAVVGGLAIAAVQLGPSWELARFVGMAERDRMFYSFPPAHWAELAIPRLFRGLAGGPEAPYWFGQQTTGFEAALYVGTVPIVLACVGLIAGARGLRIWVLLVALTFALATMPRWWPAGYAGILLVPGLGFFRCPARYTILTSLGLALLAGAGLDRAIPARRLTWGVLVAVLFGLLAFAWASWWTSRPAFRPAFATEPMLLRLGPAALAWVIAVAAVVAWRRGRVGAIVLVALATAELGALYYAATTRWGWSVSLPAESPILTRLAEDPEARLVGGALDNLPVRAGLATATPYVGFTMPEPNALLRLVAADPRAAGDPLGTALLRRLGVTHLVFEAPGPTIAGAFEVDRGPDPALDALAYRSSEQAASRPRTWTVQRLPDPASTARPVTSLRVAPSQEALLQAMSVAPPLSREAWAAAGDLPADWNPSTLGQPARLVEWDGARGVVEHEGPCLLVLNRTYYPGWTYRVNDGPERPVARVDGGLQGLWIDGRGTSRVAVRYQPTRFGLWRGLSIGGLIAALGLIGVGKLAQRREDAKGARKIS